MAPDAVPGSIADRVAQSLAAFEAAGAIETQAQPEDSHVIWVEAIGDQLSKFKLWAGNIGAHRTGRSSLDYRLRDSSNLHTQVVRLLDDLITSLNEALSILSGERVPWDRDLGEADELDEELKNLLINEDFEFDSELGQLTKEIDDTIGRLLRLSISLRNPAPHDRFMSTEYAKVRYFEANDKAHVEAKFPQASQTLIVRLGQALSQRRQYFRYREAHHEKLARGLFDSGRSEAGAQSTVASSVPLAMKGPEAVPVFGELDEDERSDTGFSQTSFATTAPGSERLRIPPLPKRSYDGPFECPFCFMLISVSSTYQWKKHVLRDLRPYICLAEDCQAASKEYGRRHEWMNHMLQKHWKTWLCPYRCGLHDTTETNLREHLARVHGLATQMELDALIARCGQTQSLSSPSPIDCPLCQDTLESVQQYQQHVGRHQVDLALFALPKIYDEDEELDEHDDNQETVSTRSESYSVALSDLISPTRLSDIIFPTPLPEPTQNRDIAHAEEHEAGPRFSFEREPRGDHSADSQDGEWSVEEDDDIIVRIRPRRDSQNRSARLSFQDDSVIIEREIIDHYRDTDHGEFVDNKRVDNFSDPGSDGDNNRASRSREDNQDEPERFSLSTFKDFALRQKEETAQRELAAQKSDEYGRAWSREQSEKPREQATREEVEMPELEQERRARQYKREAAQKEYELERAQKDFEELKLVARIEQDGKRREQADREERELHEAKKELDTLDERIEREWSEHRVKQKIELDRLKKEEAALAEKKHREKEAKEAVERYREEEEGDDEFALFVKESGGKDARDVLERSGEKEAERALLINKISDNENYSTDGGAEDDRLTEEDKKLGEGLGVTPSSNLLTVSHTPYPDPPASFPDIPDEEARTRLRRDARYNRRKAERKAEAEAERAKKETEASARLEREARDRLEAEAKAAATAEAAAKARLEATIKAEAEAKAAAAKKATEEAEWRKRLEEEAKLKAEIEARKKLEEEKAAAETAKAAGDAKKNADDTFKKQALEEAEPKAVVDKKTTEEAEWRKNLEKEAKLKAEIEVRKKIEEEKAAAEDANQRAYDAAKKEALEEAKPNAAAAKKAAEQAE